jgi:hypothetical protein
VVRGLGQTSSLGASSLASSEWLERERLGAATTLEPQTLKKVAAGNSGEKRMTPTRREFTIGSLLALTAAGMPVFVRAAGGKTVALLFDSLVSPFWVSGIEIMRQKAKDKGWQTLENISNFDDNKQFEQV